MAQPPFHPRTLAGTLNRAARQFPAVVVTGPRQSGKTTLVRQLFSHSHQYCSLDDPLVRRQAEDDPALVLSRFAPPVIFDEIQYVPGLLHAVKVDIDRHRGERGRFILTGSQSFTMMEGVTESLAGRAAVLALQSLSHREIHGRPEPYLSWTDVLLSRGTDESGGTDPLEIAAAILRGGYPEPALAPELDVRLWYGSYLQTYLERDIRSLRAVGDLRSFEDFLFALAARSGSLINWSDLARDLQVSAKTVKEWISILEASGQVVVTRPYHSSLGKRLVKSPKVFFLDSGLLSYLLALTEPEQILQGMAAGPVFEAAVLGQLHRLLIHRGEVPRIYFWRTSQGHEVDFIVERGTSLIPIEVKLTATPTPRHAAALERIREDFGERVEKGLLVCLCRERFQLTENVEAVPFGGF